MIMDSRFSHHSLTIAMVNYKTLYATTRCLSLINQLVDTSVVNIVVVDNNSADESLKFLKTLNWITLIERKPECLEQGFIAHGLGLDLAAACHDNDYLLIMHTDTFIYDLFILKQMLEKISKINVAAVGCLEQVNRSRLSMSWKFLVRVAKYYARKSRLKLGLKTRPPRHYTETHIKSFFALWNLRLIKEHKLHFSTDGQNPSYNMQDILRSKDYTIEIMHPAHIFKYLDHLKAGTKKNKVLTNAR